MRRRAKTAVALGALGVLAALLLDPCSVAPHASLPSTPRLVTHVTVPLTVVQRTAAGGKGLVVPVRVGTGATLPLLLDTGATGLHVLADDVPTAGATRTGRTTHETYSDGTELFGEEALAVVAFGGAETTVPIVIDLVDQVGCTVAHPACSGTQGKGFFHAHGVRGILGIGLGPPVHAIRIFSPIAQLPGDLANGFVIHTEGDSAGLLTVGLSPDQSEGFRFIPLTQDTRRLENGGPIWRDSQVSVCYSLDGTAIQESCTGTHFDTGATTVLWNAKNIPADQLVGGRLKPGATFHATVPGVFSWSFTVGRSPQPGIDMVVSQPSLFNTNLGMGIFFRYDVMFDIRNGRLGLRPN